MDEVSELYRKDLEHFLDPEWIKKASEKEVQSAIEKTADAHMRHVATIKSMIHGNKKLMEEFWKKNFTDEETGEEIIPKDIRESGVKAFMFIHKKQGELVLEYMNRQDMKNILYTVYE